jgi:hypothetical protein
MIKQKITVEFTQADVNVLHEVYDLITNAQTDLTLYYQFEDIVRKLSNEFEDEVQKQIQKEFLAKRHFDRAEWEDQECLSCKHTAKYHVKGGTGLCTKMDCTLCFEFKGKPKPKPVKA